VAEEVKEVIAHFVLTKVSPLTRAVIVAEYRRMDALHLYFSISRVNFLFATSL